MKAKLRIIGAGGCGANLLQRFIDIPNADGYPLTEKVIIDTSDSDVNPNAGIPIYRIPGVNGMGQDRGALVQIAGDKIDAILQEFKPGTLNVLVGSLAGGSGSALNFLLMREMLARGLPVVFFAVASSASGKEITNTINSLESLAKLTRSGRPVPIAYYENTNEDDDRDGTGIRTDVDEWLANDLRALALVFSEEHHKLDRKDMENFFNYSKVTPIKPQMVELKLAIGDADLSSVKDHTIATFSLLKAENEPVPELGQQYGPTGFYRDGIAEGADNITFLLTAKDLPDRVAALQLKKEYYDSVEKKLNASKAAVELDDGDDMEMVF